ncbi:hypothetical protein CALCODRAFT_479072 [Calocera cornea HHB12733]|uniref:Ribosomal protein/NADH dehydrogenase domain-containing protein n=1 Tax=Calocera cornea HHB12733 TaxID=1353952 RepID=A0A165JZP4_9BASI|nr:hypothetical protein CALCODRAFT_479072 [Calocera cornea HHB12733]
MTSVFRSAASAAKPTETRVYKPSTLALALKKLSPPVPLKKDVGLRHVKLVYQKDVHASARHFARDLYPRVVYSNPHIKFAVDRLPLSEDKSSIPPPEWVLSFKGGIEKRLPLAGMLPTGVMRALVDEVGAVRFEGGLAKIHKETATKPEPEPEPEW